MRLCPRQRQERAHEATEPPGLAVDHIEEPVALARILLRALHQHFHGGRDGGEGRAQLVRRVRDELTLGALPPLALGLAADAFGLGTALWILLVAPAILLVLVPRPGCSGVEARRADGEV